LRHGKTRRTEFHYPARRPQARRDGRGLLHSFGFLHGSQTGGVIQDKHLQAKWRQAELRWYAGSELLHSAGIPAKVMKHLESDLNATVEVKLFRAGQLLRSLGTIQAKH